MKTNKILGFCALLFLAVTIQNCKTASPTSTSSPVVPVSSVSYEKELKPIMVASCTPCHFPEKGKKKMLDTYEATKANIADIIARVQLAPSHEDFMPYLSKKTPLTAAEIKLFQDWAAGGMAR